MVTTSITGEALPSGRFAGTARVLLAGALTLLLVAGCGSGENSAEEASTSTGSSASESASAAPLLPEGYLSLFPFADPTR